MFNNIDLINFTDLNEEEKLMVLVWRNNPSVKKWMYTTEDILLENHLNFIQSLKNREDKLYFVIKRDSEYLGVIDFVNIKKNISAEMGIYINPELKGLGKLFMEIIIEYSFKELNIKTIFSEVFEENEKAFSLYQKFGFKLFDKKTVNNRNVICMELENENR